MGAPCPLIVSPSDPANTLNEAFRLFSAASAGLEHAYSELQGKVARLTEELAAANGELRRQFEAKLELAERLQALLDAVPAGVVVLDGSGNVETANPAAGALFNRVLPGMAWRALKERHLAATEAPDEWVLHGKSEGAPRRVILSESAGVGRGGCIVILQDVTSAHEMTRRMEHNQRLAAMGEMAAGLAHQLRTPLAAAMLYGGLLQRPNMDETERVSHARKMNARLKHLERLIQDVLLFARGDVVGRERLTVGEIADFVRQTFGPLAQDRGLHFFCQAEGHAGCVSANRESLTGALSALVENAFSACADGPGHGDVRFLVDASGSGIRFRVKDNGPGISPSAQDRLFEPFYTTRAEGTGLGLAIAHGVARAHGGSLEARNRRSGGAEFTLFLPAHLEARARDAEVMA